MCGIIGIVNSDTTTHVNQSLIDALTILQHRGQDAAGIVTVSNSRLNLRKDIGTVAEVFTQDTVINLRGNVGIGHVRYPTAGGSRQSEAQPLYTNSPFGIALAHNGNLTNTAHLLKSMVKEHRHINTDSDSELLLNVFADELQRRQIANITPDDIFDSVRVLMRKCKGAYAVIVLINRIGLVAFRDPSGIRPLCFGSRKNAVNGKTDYAVASESVAIDALDAQFKLERDVAPGEAIFLSMSGDIYTKITNPGHCFAPCLFEYVYFARPDSVLDGVPVYEARSRMGAKLAQKILRLDCWSDGQGGHDIDTVIPIPETSRVSALQCAHVLQRPYREGFIKNRYIARTFIMPGQEMRRKTVRLKLNSVKSEFEGKVVLLVDDSIVRGTTSTELIQMARDAGARKVYFASAAPPVRYSNVYGIDIPTRGELVAHGRSEEEVCAMLGADKVIYNDLSDCEEAVRSLNPTHLDRFESSCFNGDYVTEEVTAEYLDEIERGRGKGRKGSTGTGGGGTPGKPGKPPTHNNSDNSHNSNGSSNGLVRSHGVPVGTSSSAPSSSTIGVPVAAAAGAAGDIFSSSSEGIFQEQQKNSTKLNGNSGSNGRIGGEMDQQMAGALRDLAEVEEESVFENFSSMCETLHNHPKSASPTV